MINYRLFLKLKLLENGEFNHLNNIFMSSYLSYCTKIFYKENISTTILINTLSYNELVFKILKKNYHKQGNEAL